MDVEVEGGYQAEANRGCKRILTGASLGVGAVQRFKSPPSNAADTGLSPSPGRVPTCCRATEARRPQPLGPNSKAHKPQPRSPGASREMEQLWEMQSGLQIFIVNKNEIDHKIISTVAGLYTFQPQRSEARASATTEACALRTRAREVTAMSPRPSAGENPCSKGDR